MPGLSAAQTAKIARSAVVVLTANRFISQLVRTLFFGLGMQDVAVADTAEAALERFELCKLDLIVVDTGPATFNAAAAVKALRSLGDSRQAGLPIIVLTGPGIAWPGDLKMIQTVSKPISTKEFKRVVLRLLLNIEVEQDEGLCARPAPARMTTLLLSENPYTAQVIRALLLSLGLADVAIAATKNDAEDKLASAGFDLVIADSGPASFDALATVEAIHGRVGATLAAKPVLLLASNPSAGLVERAKAAQVTAIATKPLDPDAFGDRVRKMLFLRA